MDAKSLKLLQQLDPSIQRNAQEKLQVAMKNYAEADGKKKAEIAEQKKIKIDPVVAKYLVSEFNLPLADAETLLRVHNNDLDAVLDQLVNASL